VKAHQLRFAINFFVGLTVRGKGCWGVGAKSRALILRRRVVDVPMRLRVNRLHLLVRAIPLSSQDGNLLFCEGIALKDNYSSVDQLMR
jgi:hypothetical protein